MRIGKSNGHRLVLGLQPQPDPRNGAAGSRSAGEAVDLAIHLRPDFFGRGFDMRAAIGDIVELVCPDRIFGLLGKAARGVNEMAGVGIGRGGNENQFGVPSARSVSFFS